MTMEEKQIKSQNLKLYKSNLFGESKEEAMNLQDGRVFNFVKEKKKFQRSIIY